MFSLWYFIINMLFNSFGMVNFNVLTLSEKAIYIKESGKY